MFDTQFAQLYYQFVLSIRTQKLFSL